jgi:hypothetical protein
MPQFIRETPYANPLTGLSNDVIQGLLGYMKDKQRTQQMQGLASLLESTGIPQTVERAAYAESPAGLLNALTNVNRANVPLLKPETADALMTLAPVPSGANKAAMAVGRAGERYAEKVVPQIMERGGLPAGLLQDLAQGTQRQIFVPATKDEAFKASKMLKNDKSAKEVWQELGVVKAPDGEWRKEISDQSAHVKGSKPYEDILMRAYFRGENETGDKLYKTTVDDVFWHGKLKEAYPELMGIETQMLPKTSQARGSLSMDTRTGDQILKAREDLSPEQAKSTILHELQHAIQEKEGFSVGGNTDTMDRMIADAKFRAYMLKESDDYKLAEKELNKIYDDFFVGNIDKEQFKKANDNLLQKYPIVNEYRSANDVVFDLGRKPEEAYKRLMGEAEARLTQRRIDLTPEQRLQNYPYEYTGNVGYGLDVYPNSLIHLDNKGNLIGIGLLGQ